MKLTFLYLFILLVLSCKTSKLDLGKECRDFERLLVEFASKIESHGDSCIVFHYDRDTLKFINFKYYGNGREYFHLDHRYYENFYLQHKLTDDHGDLHENHKKCLSEISKDYIIKLFGDNYIFRSFENRIYYNICFENKLKQFSGIQIQLNKEDKVQYMLIYL